MLPETTMAIEDHPEEVMVNTTDLESTPSEAEEARCLREEVEATIEVPEKIVTMTVVMMNESTDLFEAIVDGEEVESAVEVGAEELNPAQTTSQLTRVDMKSSRELEVVTHLSELRSDTCPVFNAYL